MNYAATRKVLREIGELEPRIAARERALTELDAYGRLGEALRERVADDLEADRAALRAKQNWLRNRAVGGVA